MSHTNGAKGECPFDASSDQAGVDVQSLPLPPIVRHLPEADQPYPTPQQSKEDQKKHGGVFTYQLGKGRITVFTDPSQYHLIFHAQTDYPEISVNEGVARIARVWFQIPAEFDDFTRQGLDAVRKAALNPMTARGLNDDIGAELQNHFDALPEIGQISVRELAHATFLPVNRALFGKECVPPEAEEWFHAFDGKLPLILYMGIDAFPDAKEAYENIVSMFERAILRGDHLPDSGVACPALEHRLAVLPEGTDRWDGQCSLSVRILSSLNPSPHSIPLLTQSLLPPPPPPVSSLRLQPHDGKVHGLPLLGSPGQHPADDLLVSGKHVQ
jgi:hypothetical protein